MLCCAWHGATVLTPSGACHSAHNMSSPSHVLQGAAAALPALAMAMAAEERDHLLVRAVLWMANAQELHVVISSSSMGCLQQVF